MHAKKNMEYKQLAALVTTAQLLVNYSQNQRMLYAHNVAIKTDDLLDTVWKVVMHLP